MDIKIKQFTGPLDLLLKLISQEKMDILEIDTHKITEQYLLFLKDNDILNLDSAGEFVQMAAWLIYIKSKNLLPSDAPLEAEAESEQELQQKLIYRLLKMQSVQKMCQKFNQYYLLNRDTWSAGGLIRQNLSVIFPHFKEESIKQQPILKLMRTYKKLFQKTEAASSTKFSKPPLPLLVNFIRSINLYLTKGSSFKMSFLVEKKENKPSYNLITFLSLLELSRLGIVSLEQKQDYSDIDIFVKKSIKDTDFNVIREVQGGNFRKPEVMV